jgi:hypothetical protein
MPTLFRKLTAKAEPLTLKNFKEVLATEDFKKAFVRVQRAQGEDYAKAKKALPAVTWQANFEPGKTRSNANARPSGLFIMDYDHVENPFELYHQILAKCQLNWRERYIMAAHCTPSGKGLRLVLRMMLKDKSIEENQKYFGETIGEKYDEAVHDLARLSFLVPLQNFYYLDNKIFEYVENHSKGADSPAADHPDAPDGEGGQKEEGEKPSSSEPDTKSAEARREADREKLLDTRFRGTSYRAIVDAMVQRDGGVPTVGERNVRLYNLARKLRYIVDFDAKKLALLLPTFGLPIDEVKAVAESSIKGGRTGKIPYDLWKTIEGLKGESEEAEEPKPLPALPPLPPLFDELVRIAPESFQVPVILSLLPVVGTLMSKLRARYIDGNEHSPSFMTVVEAPQASGKSFTRTLVDLLMEPVKMRDAEGKIKEREYAKLLKQSKNAKSQPEEPVCIIRKLPISISIAKLLKRLDNSNGLHLFSFCEELDTLTKSNSSGAWAQKSDIYRNAFDNAYYGQDYMSENSYSADLQVFYNMLICGTPKAVSRFFKDPEDGLCSRVIFAQLEDQFGKKMPVWKKLTQKQHQKITSLCEVLDDRFCLNANGDVRQPFLIDMKKTNKALENWLEKKRIEAIKASDVALDTFRRRSAVIGFRAAMLASVLYEGAKVKDVTKRINAFAVFIADTVLAALLNKFGDAVRQQPTTAHGTTSHVTLFDMMKDNFTREELNAALATTKRETPARKVVSRWMSAGLIEKVGKNVWQKKK